MCEICVGWSLCRVSKPRQALRPSTGTGAGTCGSPGAFHSTPVAPGALSWLALTLPRVRYKILPAQCCAEQSGTKLSPHA